MFMMAYCPNLCKQQDKTFHLGGYTACHPPPNKPTKKKALLKGGEHVSPVPIPLATPWL